MDYAIDDELRPLIELIPPTDLDDIVGSRAQAESFLELMNADIEFSGVSMTDMEVPTPNCGRPVTVRFFVPDGPSPATGRPALLHLHGGGFVAGSIDLELGFLVETTRRLGIDRARIGVGGGSAGGGGSRPPFALLARDRQGPALCFQYLGIPELDYRLETVSMRTFTDTPVWNRAAAERSWQYYLGPIDGEVSPYASPAIADDLGDLPPAYVTTMEFDPFRDEGILYALRLLHAGVSVELHSYPGIFHGSQAVATAAVSMRAQEELMLALTAGWEWTTPESLTDPTPIATREE